MIMNKMNTYYFVAGKFNITSNSCFGYNYQEDKIGIKCSAKTFEEAMNKKGKELLDKCVYVEFNVWSYKIEPQTLSDALEDANEWYDAVLDSDNEEEEDDE